jgi:hypothetical protein
MDYFEQNEHNFLDRQLFSEHVQQFSKAAFIGRIRKIIDKRQRL